MNGVPVDTRGGDAATLAGRRHALCLGVLCCALLSAMPWGAWLIADVSPENPRGENVAPSAPLAAVIIEGNTTIPSEEIAKKIKSRPGRPADEKQIKADVRALFDTRWFFEVSPSLRETPDGMVLVFRIRERPILQSVTYKGNKGVKTKDLEALTGMKSGGAYDVSVNREAARRIERHYREKGYMFAEVTLEKGDSREERDVVFLINEGKKVHVTSIKVEGNDFLSDGLLKTKLKTKTQKLWLFGGKYDPATIPEDLAAIKEFYQGLGFFDVKVDPQTQISKDKSQVQLTYLVTEGTRYKVGSVSFHANR